MQTAAFPYLNAYVGQATGEATILGVGPQAAVKAEASATSRRQAPG